MLSIGHLFFVHVPKLIALPHTDRLGIVRKNVLHCASVLFAGP